MTMCYVQTTPATGSRTVEVEGACENANGACEEVGQTFQIFFIGFGIECRTSNR